MKLSQLLLAAIVATVLVGALAGSAPARTFFTTSQTLRTAFTSVTFRNAFGILAACPLTLEGSLHSIRIAKVRESLIGLVTRAELGTCSTGSMSVLRETLPWHTRYESFTGTLPNISAIKVGIVGLRVRIREPLLPCLITTTEENPGIATFSREVLTRTLTTETLGGTGIEETCGHLVTIESTRDPVTALGSATRVTVTLI
jgi:hypothetical protein